MSYELARALWVGDCGRTRWSCFTARAPVTLTTMPLVFPDHIMAIAPQVTPTKRAKPVSARVGVDAEFTHAWLQRPQSWPLSGQLLLPRAALGINEYLHMLSLRHPDAVRCVLLACLVPLPPHSNVLSS